MRVNHELSSLRFLYPFKLARFHRLPEEFDRRAAAIDGARLASRGGSGSTPLWIPYDLPRDELLPHIRKFFTPESGHTALGRARFWELDPNAAASPRGLGAAPKTSWLLHYPPGESRGGKRRGGLPFSLGGTQLALFRDGIGLLTIEASPAASAADPATSLDDWLDFQHYFRFTRRETVGVTARVDDKPFFPLLAAPCEDHGVEGPHPLDEIIAGLLWTAGRAGEEPWWQDVFTAGQLLPYSLLFLESEQSPTEQETLELLYRARNFFHSRQETHPAREDLAAEQPFLLPYVDGQWFTCSLDGGAFVAIDTPDRRLFANRFFGDTLPDHLCRVYYLAFQLAQFQRFALTALSDEVAEAWLGTRGRRRERVYARLRVALVSFTAGGLFTRIMEREHHHRFYRRWWEVLQIDELYQEVSQEIREIHEHFLMRRFQWVNLVATVGAVAAIGLGLLQAAGGAAEFPARSAAIRMLTISLVVGLLLYWAVPALWDAGPPSEWLRGWRRPRRGKRK